VKTVPTVPLAVPLLVMAGEGVFTVNVNGALPVPPLLVALRFTLNVPAVAGVPEIKPEVAFTARPVGNPVAAKLLGELAAVI